MQSPVFVSLMALLFVVIGLNLAGVFEIGMALTRLGNRDPLARGVGNDQAGMLASFGSGVLAVLVATPCTAPFMGASLGLAVGFKPQILTGKRWHSLFPSSQEKPKVTRCCTGAAVYASLPSFSVQKKKSW